MESYLELGERLKEIRGNMGLSLEQVSALTGVSKTMLSQIESSKSIPTIATVFKIANGLKIKVDSLLCGEKKQYYDVININNLRLIIMNKFICTVFFRFLQQRDSRFIIVFINQDVTTNR